MKKAVLLSTNNELLGETASHTMRMGFAAISLANELGIVL